MQKLLFISVSLFFLTAISAFQSFSQCTPDYSQTEPGFYPNYLPDAVEGQYYSVDITIVFFDEWTEWGVTCQGDEFQITGITGLPSGMNWVSNAANNTFYPQKNLYGCFNISGTPVNAGTYTVIASGTLKLSGDWLCPASYDSEAEITFTVNTDIKPSSVLTNVSCNGGSDGAIDLTVSGGVSPYSYSWSNGKTTQDISSLKAGTYTVTITDATSYQKSYSATLAESTDISTIAIVDPICIDGGNSNINATVSGGTSPYTYSWSNGASSQDLSYVTAGTYTLTTTDSKGCKDVASFTVNPFSFIEIVFLAYEPLSCYGDNDGYIDISVSGGTSPYSYSWSNGETTQDISNLKSDTYTVTITDANLCQQLGTVSISQPDQLKTTTKTTDVSCYGGSNGKIDLSVFGGLSPYKYNWSNGSKKEDATLLVVGTYTVTVKDANGCQLSATATVKQPSALTLNASVVNESCKTATLGSIDLSVSGGFSPYSYAWSNAATTEDVSNLSSGTYTVSVQDKNLCVASASYTVAISDPFKINALLTNPSCSSCNDGKISLSIMGGDAPLSYLWSNGSTSKNISNLMVGTYTVTVTDVHGCSMNKTYTLSYSSTKIGMSNLDENGNDKLIEVFPSPAKGNITIRLYGLKNEEVNIQLFNEIGQEVYRNKIQISSTVWNESFDISKISNGLYTILINNNSEIQLERKIMIEN